MLESIWLRGGPKGLASRPVIRDLNDAHERFDSSGFAFGNGLRHERQLDEQGRVIRVGNAQVGQAQLSWPTDEVSLPGTLHTADWIDSDLQSPRMSTERSVHLGEAAQRQQALARWARLHGYA